MTIFNSNWIWIHRCYFSRWRDGAIDIRYDSSVGSGELSHHISATRTVFKEIYQGINWSANKASFGYNWCDDVQRRCTMNIGGKVHSWNNVIEGWNDKSIQNSKNGVEMLSEYNIFDSMSNPDGYSNSSKRSRQNGNDPYGKLADKNQYTIGTVNFLGINDVLTQTFVDQTRALATSRTTCTNDACWEILQSAIIDAGPQ